MLYTFALGFLFGLRHALDADHIAAVASLATDSKSTNETVRVGIAWGLGHALTLFAVCAVVLVMDIDFPERVAHVVEFFVGLMLVGLGADLIRRLVRDRMHVHGHLHEGAFHVHLHTHAGEGTHKVSAHRHGHPARLLSRAVMIGLMHGLAGSAAILLLSVGAAETVTVGLIYVALFGLGSMVGMAVLSFTIAFPLRSAARFATWSLNGVNGVVGTSTVALGAVIMFDTAPALAHWLSLG